MASIAPWVMKPGPVEVQLGVLCLRFCTAVQSVQSLGKSVWCGLVTQFQAVCGQGWLLPLTRHAPNNAAYSEYNCPSPMCPEYNCSAPMYPTVQWDAGQSGCTIDNKPVCTSTHVNFHIWWILYPFEWILVQNAIKLNYWTYCGISYTLE